MKKDLCIIVVLLSFLTALTVHQIPHQWSKSTSTMTFLADGTLEYIMLKETNSFPLYFVRTDDQWLLTLDGTMHYPIDMIRFNAFLAELSRRHTVTDTGIRDHQIHKTGTSARYHLESGKFTGPKKRIFFGESGNSEQFRYISSDTVVYRTDNEIQPFLDTRTARWVDVQPFDTIFAKNSLQRAILSGNGSTPHILPQNALRSLQHALEGLYCVDVTNIPATPERTLVLELGNLSTITINFSPLSTDHVIMTEDVHTAAWILSVETAEEIFSFFSSTDRT